MMVRRDAFDLGLVAVLALYLAACWFANPTADDFIYASNARAGFAAAWVQEYLGWNGRYTSNALVLATPLAFGIPGYRAAAAIALVGTVLAVYAFVRAWAGDSVSRRDSLTCSLALCAIYFWQVPSLGESIYWYTSAATYLIWVVPTLLHLALVVRYARIARPRFIDRLSLAVAAALLVAAAGFNEIVMLMMLALYVCWFAWSLRVGSADRPRLALLCAIAVACGLVVLLSPGNAVRQSMYAGVRHRLGPSVAMTALQTLRFSADWVASGALLAAAMLFVPIADRWSARWVADRSRARQYLWMLLGGMALVVPIAVFPAYWETGVLGQHRTANVAYFAFLLLSFLALPMLLAQPGPRAAALRSFSETWRRPLAVLFVVLLATTRNSFAVGSDIVSGRLAGFDREMQQRLALLQACRDRGDRLCEVDPIRSRPASFFVVDLSPQPGDWVNVAYARYFGVPQVRARAGGDPGKHVRH